ncbi:hypothetical protein WJX74_009476 [Apatococcus lobatus]|uniref:Inositol-1,3,4-trisphosphate 5/6-kinase n=1 Tax=Apatococcus lobatus TaxID=904363 RepID=A0AAW1QLC7_9CHLO
MTVFGVIIYAHLDIDGAEDVVKWLVAGGIAVGLLYTAAKNAPLLKVKLSLVDWGFMARHLVASAKLLPHTLRHVLDELDMPSQATALYMTQPNKTLMQSWTEVHGVCPVLSPPHNLQDMTAVGEMRCLPWTDLPHFAADSHRSQSLVRVGVAMKSERQRELSRKGLLQLIPTDGVIFIPLDLNQPLQGQQPFHALLHKATDLPESGLGLTWENLEKWVDANPEVLLVDPLWAVKQVTSRGFLLYLSEQAERMDMPFAFPAASMVEGLDDMAALQVVMQNQGLRMPCILKPMLACGPKWSHDLAIVFDIRALSNAKVRTPALLQEYIDHSSVLHKVYVAGSQVGVSAQPSWPDAAIMQHQLSPSDHQMMSFNSLASPLRDYPVPAAGVPMHLVHQAVDFLRSATHLSLFGFDMVVQNNTGRIYIVDINYFPSYTVASSSRWLTSLLKKQMQQHEQRAQGSDWHRKGGSSAPA